MNTLLALVFLLGPAPEPKSTPKEVYKEIEHLEFDKGIEIDGRLRKPQGILIPGRVGEKYEDQIAERRDFHRDLYKSLEKLDTSAP